MSELILYIIMTSLRCNNKNKNNPLYNDERDINSLGYRLIILEMLMMLQGLGITMSGCEETTDESYFTIYKRKVVMQ